MNQLHKISESEMESRLGWEPSTVKTLLNRLNQKKGAVERTLVGGKLGYQLQLASPKNDYGQDSTD